MGQKLSNLHCLADKTMDMCEDYSTQTYSTIVGASSCRCIGLTGCLHCNQESFTRFLGKTLVIWYSQLGRGHKKFKYGYEPLKVHVFYAHKKLKSEEVCF
jgi:hypothetical protein